ncbi:M50 family metallopeptidase [Haloglycomyces albus]|uniref:M50 family metallopeptidase n=1 Tax=Haloglycomyces albus TaxID=526067 RepID=UPI00046D1DBB|nr:site-2 protease family protein [Haloglycomyces albus]
MPAYITGVILFALAILISISLHEFGHLLTAKAFKIKASRYFVGFGPTIWSFQKGETEYGLKAIPLGGFVKIIGMTPDDEEEEGLDEKDKKRVFWRKPLWQRSIVLAAGSITHFILAFVILWVLISFVGIANPALAKSVENARDTATISVAECIPPDDATSDFTCSSTDEPTPARTAGLEDGDEITAVDGQNVSDWNSLLAVVGDLEPNEPTTVEVERDGERTTFDLTPYAAEVQTTDGSVEEVARLGVSVYVDPTIDPVMESGPVAGFADTVGYTGDMFQQTFIALKDLPKKIAPLWDSIFGGERGEDTPVSVVGASRLGGEMVEHDQWVMFFMLLVVLNYFIGVFNLLPLLPLDGGHIAIAWYEKARSWVATRFGKPDPGRVDYYKLMPLTYVVLIVLGGFMLLTITADIVNPITIFN